VALWQKMTCNSRHPMCFRHPVKGVEFCSYTWIIIYVYGNRNSAVFIYIYHVKWCSFFTLHIQHCSWYPSFINNVQNACGTLFMFKEFGVNACMITNAHTHTRTHLHTHTHTHTHSHTHTHIYMYICIYVYTHTHTYICTYVYIYINILHNVYFHP